MSYVYYFENINKEIIYVGHTKNIGSRMNSHFGPNGHLDGQCYEEANFVYYAELNSLNEARLYEIYFIGKLKPKYNSVFSEGGFVTLELPPLDFKLYDLKKDGSSALSDELMKSHKELLHKKIQQELKVIRESSKTLTVCCPLEIESFARKSRLSPSDRDKIIRHDKLLKYHNELILQKLEQIEKVLSVEEPVI